MDAETGGGTGGGGRRWIGRALAPLALAPSILHLVGSGGEDALLVALALLAAPVAGRRDAAGAWLLAAGFAFLLPLVPVLLGGFGFGLERVLAHGALGWLAWRGAIPARRGGGWARGARVLLALWALWATGRGLAAAWAAFPEGFPLAGFALERGLLGLLRSPSMVDPTYPIHVLVQRLELVLFLWAGFELALERAELARRLALRFACALPVALALGIVERVASWAFRGGSLLERARVEGLARLRAPLPEHNSLGSVLVLLLPLATWVLVDAWSARPRARGRVALAAAALLSGGLLLVASRSKSAFLGIAAALFVGALLVLASRRGALGRRLVALVGAGVALVGILNLIPAERFERFRGMRRAQDVVRVVRFDQMRSYLAANRYAVWSGGAAMVREDPIFGVGLGRFPTELARHHDPDADAAFNPLHENAHDQYLQWAAEEGLVGLALGLAVFFGAMLGWLRGARAPGASERDLLLALAGATALAGLWVNLLVGHALLVPGAALCFAGVAGAGLAAGERERAARATGRAPRELCAGALVLALLPGLWRERPPAEGFGVGCYPWEWQPGTAWGRARMLAPEARWIVRWGERPRLILPLKDVRPASIEGVQRVDVAIEGAWVHAGLELPRSSSLAEQNPLHHVKVDRPADVSPGELVTVRVRSGTRFAGSRMFGLDQSIVGPRALPVTFVEPR